MINQSSSFQTMIDKSAKSDHQAIPTD